MATSEAASSALLVDEATQLRYIVLARELLESTVICIHGSGSEDFSKTWIPLAQEISKRAPVLYYERPDNQSPEDAVRNLDKLLKLPPPYILVAHSYGGAIARQFLQGHQDEVAGMVLAETGNETPIKHEQEQYRKQILKNRPLSVIKANPRYQVPAELAEAWAKENLRLKRAQLQLSSNTRFVNVDNSGHHIIRDRPDAVAEEVFWVIDNQVAPSSGNSLKRLVGRLFRARTAKSCK